MRKDYKYLIFDADHTLIDFDADVERAFHKALAAIGRDEPAVLRTCVDFDNGNWDRIGLSDVHSPEVQARFHELYRAHVRAIFEHAGAVHGFLSQARQTEETFNREFCAPAHFIEGARETVEKLSKKYRICVATNGLTDMQYGRLEPFAPYLYRVFVSEELGAIKPSGEYFDYLLKALGAKAQECLMIGDSLSSDMAGASAAGMDRVWFNRSRSALPRGVSVTAEIHKIAELVPLLEG